MISMLAPADRRAALWALFAFNHEIAKTREVVSEPMLGMMRLQWWRDEIGKIYGGKDFGKHEVLEPLALAIRAYDLPQTHFEMLLEAREFDLGEEHPANIEGLLNYADFTNAPLLKLALQTSGGDPETEPVQAISINYGLAGVLRAVPYHAAQGRCLWPEDLMKEHGLDPYIWAKPENRGAVQEMTGRIAKEFVSGVRADSVILKPVQKLADMYFKQIKAYKFDVFSPKMAAPPPLKALRLLVSRWL